METNHRIIAAIGTISFFLIVAALMIVFLLRLESSDIVLGTNEERINSLQATNTVILERLASVRSEQTRIATSLIEVETQFCASDIVRNLMHAHDMRIQSMLWNRIYKGEKLPTDNAFYPTICNRPTTGTPEFNAK